MRFHKPKILPYCTNSYLSLINKKYVGEDYLMNLESIIS